MARLLERRGHGYKVYRGSGPTGDNLTPLAAPGNVTSYSDTGLSGGSQAYTYAVSAITAGGEGCQSMRATATTGGTVRTLNLATSPGAVGCSNINTHAEQRQRDLHPNLCGLRHGDVVDRHARRDRLELAIPVHLMVR